MGTASSELPDAIDQRISRWVRRWLRSDDGRSQSGLAATAGVPTTSLSHYVRGTRRWPASAVYAIARAANATVCDLYGLEEGHQAAAFDVGLTGPERKALDNIARELVNLRAPNSDQPTRGQLFMREMVQAWPTMDEEERQEWRELAAEIRRADEADRS